MWVSIFEQHQDAYLALQQCFLETGEGTQALLWAERGKSRELLRLLPDVSSQTDDPFDTCDDAARAELERIAAQQEAGTVIVEYSVYNGNIFCWVWVATGCKHSVIIPVEEAKSDESDEEWEDEDSNSSIDDADNDDQSGLPWMVETLMCAMIEDTKKLTNRLAPQGMPLLSPPRCHPQAI